MTITVEENTLHHNPPQPRALQTHHIHHQTQATRKCRVQHPFCWGRRTRQEGQGSCQRWKTSKQAGSGQAASQHASRDFLLYRHNQSGEREKGRG